MSRKHPIISITGSSGAGTTSVMRTFAQIFRREGVTAAFVEGDSFHRYDRAEMKAAMAQAQASGDSTFSLPRPALCAASGAASASAAARIAAFVALPTGCPSPLSLLSRTNYLNIMGLGVQMEKVSKFLRLHACVQENSHHAPKGLGGPPKQLVSHGKSRQIVLSHRELA